jgi:hypothetical protein
MHPCAYKLSSTKQCTHAASAWGGALRTYRCEILSSRMTVLWATGCNLPAQENGNTFATRLSDVEAVCNCTWVEHRSGFWCRLGTHVRQL